MITIKKKLCLNNILEQIDEFSIIKSIIPNADLKNKFKIRNENKKSASITKIYNGRLYIRDFGNPLQSKAETWYQFLIRENGWLEGDVKSYMRALDWANITFNLNLERFNENIKIDIKKIYNYHNIDVKNEREVTIIKVKRRNIEIRDINFWKQYGLNEEWLLSKKISPIQYLWIINNKGESVYNVNNTPTFIYPYYFIDNIFRCKIYSPYGRYKWISNVNADIIENWHNIKEHKENCIIQTSLKDIGVMEYFRDKYSIFSNYDFVAPISESIWFNKWNILRSKYPKLIYYGNNDIDKEDNSGLNYARKWSLKYNIHYIVNPDYTKSSDISDYRKLKGEKETIVLLKKLENEINEYYNY